MVGSGGSGTGTVAGGIPRKVRGGLGTVAVAFLIRVYRRFVSPMLAPSCRYTPTCSAYALEAVERHGAARGALLAARRVLRCNPLFPGGFDPVPEAGPGRTGASPRGVRR